MPEAFYAKDRLISVSLGHCLSPQESYERRLEDPNVRSVGTFQIKVRDVHGVGGRVIDDTECEGVPDGHANIDFRGLSKEARKLARYTLSDKTTDYGLQYDPSVAASQPSQLLLWEV